MNDRCPQCIEHYAAARIWRDRTALRRWCLKVDRFIVRVAVTCFVLGAVCALLFTFIAFYH